MIALFCGNVFILLLIHSLKNYVQTLFILQVSHWQIFLSALDKRCNAPSSFIRSLSFWPVHFSHWLLFTSAAALLRPMHWPKLFLPLWVTQSPLSPRLFLGLSPVSTSWLLQPSLLQPVTCSFSRHCSETWKEPKEGLMPSASWRCLVKYSGWKCPWHAGQYCLMSTFLSRNCQLWRKT